MADPSVSTVMSLIGKAFNIYDEVLESLTNSSEGYPVLEAQLLSVLDPGAPQVANATIQIRQQLANFFAIGNRRATVDPLIILLGKIKGYTEADVLSIWRRFCKEEAAAGRTIKTRNYQYGMITGPTGTGNGNLYRYTLDQYGYPIETPFPEAKTLKCVSDATNGAVVQEEIFQFQGQTTGQDILDLRGSGAVVNIRAYSARDSLINNPSFSIVTGTTPAVDSLPGWTLDSGTLPVVDGSNYYRGFQGDTTPYAAKFAADAVISQLLSVRGSTFSADAPYNLIVAYNRSVGSGTGTLTITLGDKTKTVNLTTASSGWQRVTLNLSSSDLWYLNWSATSPAVKIGVSGSSGYVLIDDVLLVPGYSVDGSWYFLCGGSTPYLRDDQFSWTDSTNDREYGIIARWSARTYGVVPPTSQSPVYPDPT